MTMNKKMINLFKKKKKQWVIYKNKIKVVIFKMKKKIFKLRDKK